MGQKTVYVNVLLITVRC